MTLASCNSNYGVPAVPCDDPTTFFTNRVISILRDCDDIADSSTIIEAHSQSRESAHQSQDNTIIPADMSNTSIVLRPLTDLLNFLSPSQFPNSIFLRCLNNHNCSKFFTDFDDLIDHVYRQCPTDNEFYKRFLPHELYIYKLLQCNFGQSVPDAINGICKFNPNNQHGIVYRVCPFPDCNYTITNPLDFRNHFNHHARSNPKIASSLAQNGIIWTIITAYIKCNNNIPSISQILKINNHENLGLYNRLSNVNICLHVSIFFNHFNYGLWNGPPFLIIYHQEDALNNLTIKFQNGGLILDSRNIEPHGVIREDLNDIEPTFDRKVEEIDDDLIELDHLLTRVKPTIEEPDGDLNTPTRIEFDQNVNNRMETLRNTLVEIFNEHIRNYLRANSNLQYPAIKSEVCDYNDGVLIGFNNYNTCKLIMPRYNNNNHNLEIVKPKFNINERNYDIDLWTPNFNIQNVNHSITLPAFNISQEPVNTNVPIFNIQSQELDVNIPTITKKQEVIDITTPALNINNQSINIDVPHISQTQHNIDILTPSYNIHQEEINIPVPEVRKSNEIIEIEIPKVKYKYVTKEISIEIPKFTISNSQQNIYTNQPDNNLSYSNAHSTYDSEDNVTNNSDSDPSDSFSEDLIEEDEWRPEDLINDLKEANSQSDIILITKKWKKRIIINKRIWTNNQKEEDIPLTNLMVIKNKWPGVNTFPCPHACGLSFNNVLSLNNHQDSIHKKRLKGNQIHIMAASMINKPFFVKVSDNNNERQFYLETVWSCCLPNCNYFSSSSSALASHIKKKPPNFSYC